MGLLLQVLGVLFIVVLVGLVVLFFVLRRKLRSWAAGLEAMAYGDTPTRIHLEPSEGDEWWHADEVASRRAEFARLGFAETGVYEPDRIYGLRLVGLHQAEQGLLAVVYDHKQAGVWVDVVVRYPDQSGLTVSDGTQGQEVDSTPWSRTVRRLGATVSELVETALTERGAGPWLPAEASDFVPAFERAYAREVDWRNARGGPSDEEIRRVAAQSGEELTDEALAKVRRRLRWQALAGLFEALHERLYEARRPSKAERHEWDGRVLAVHEVATREELCESVGEHVDTDDEVYGPLLAHLRDDAGSNRTAFAAANAGLAEAMQFRLLATVSEPTEADLYLAPGSGDEDDDGDEDDEG